MLVSNLTENTCSFSLNYVHTSFYCSSKFIIKSELISLFCEDIILFTWYREAENIVNSKKTKYKKWRTTDANDTKALTLLAFHSHGPDKLKMVLKYVFGDVYLSKMI